MISIDSALAAFRSGKGLKGQLLRGGVGSVAIKIFSAGLNLTLAVVLARALGAEGFGAYSFVLALVTIMAFPAQLGLPNLVVRETAKAQANGDWALIKRLWRWSTTTALMMSAGLIAIGALVAWLFAKQVPAGSLPVLFWGLALVPLIALGNIRGAAMRGLRHVVQGQLPEFILRPAFLVLFVVGMVWLSGAERLHASLAMMLHVLAAASAFFVGLLLLSRQSAPSMRGVAYANIDTRPWLAAALPMAMMEGMLTINDNIGLLVFGAFASPQDVGLLRISLQLSAFVTFGFLAVNVAITPYIARFYQEGAHEKLKLLALRAAQVSTVGALPVAAIFIFGGRQVIYFLFGSDFVGASLPLTILTFGQVVNALTGCAGAMLYMTGHEAVVVKIVGGSCLLNLALTLILGLIWGVTGAAVAAALATVFWNVMLFVHVKKVLNINSSAAAV